MQFAGTGTYVGSDGEDGLWLVAGHMGNASLSISNHSATMIDYGVANDDPPYNDDWALIKTIKYKFQLDPLPYRIDVKMGENVLYVNENKMRIMTATVIEIGDGYFKISGAAEPGNSGSAILDENGNLLGVLVRRSDKPPFTVVTQVKDTMFDFKKN